MMLDKLPRVSVVIPSYNSEKTIKACLYSVINQKTNLAYEIIVADSSTDRTPELIRENFPQVKLIRSESRMYRGKARNEGIKEAKGGIIICIDADCVAADEKWLDTLFKLNGQNSVVGTRICSANLWNIFGWGIFLIEFSEFISKRDKKVDLLLSYNVSYKRGIFKKYGFFPDHQYINEDLLFQSRIQDNLFFTGKTAVKHINRTNPFEILKHCYDIGLGSGLARKQKSNLEGHFLFKYPFLIPLLYFYRYFRAGYRVLCTPRYVPVFILASPLVLINLIPYTAGFLTAAFKKA